MCTPGSNLTLGITQIEDASERVKGECVCRVTPVATADGNFDNANLHIVVQDFKCTRDCEWRMKVYHDGCTSLDTCCSTGSEFRDENFLIRSQYVRADTVVYISHENDISDQTGTLLAVSVRTSKYMG